MHDNDDYVADSLFARWFEESAAIDLAADTIEGFQQQDGKSKMVNGLKGVALRLPKPKPKSNTRRNARRDSYLSRNKNISRDELLAFWQDIFRKINAKPDFTNLNEVKAPEIEPKAGESFSAQYSAGAAWMYGFADKTDTALMNSLKRDMDAGLFVDVRADNENFERHHDEAVA